jgi:hypothetical protein
VAAKSLCSWIHSSLVQEQQHYAPPRAAPSAFWRRVSQCTCTDRERARAREWTRDVRRCRIAYRAVGIPVFEVLHNCFGIAEPSVGAARSDLVHPNELLGCQRELNRRRVLLEQSHLLRPERSGRRPCPGREARRARAAMRSLPSLRDFLNPIDESRLHSECRSITSSVPGTTPKQLNSLVHWMTWRHDLIPSAAAEQRSARSFSRDGRQLTV